MKEQLDLIPPPPSPIQNKTHRTIISISTGLALGGMLASLALIDVGPGGKLRFRWHWAVIPLMTVGLVLGMWFWRRVFRSAELSPEAGDRALRQGAIVLAIAALAGFFYPIRFIQADQRREVFIGLGLAILVLATVGVLVRKLIRWVSENEPKDGDAG